MEIHKIHVPVTTNQNGIVKIQSVSSSSTQLLSSIVVMAAVTAVANDPKWLRRLAAKKQHQVYGDNSNVPTNLFSAILTLENIKDLNTSI